MADFRTDRAAVAHHLSAALRFVDAFTARPVGVPLHVQADVLPVPVVVGTPNTPWKALPGPYDGTYRFFVTNHTIAPVGPVAISVAAPGKEYVNHEPFSVPLPRPLLAHPPTPAPSDFLVERPLWPTRVLPLPPGETAIVGTVRSVGATPIAALRIRIWPSALPMPATPYAYTDASGGFVFRLPGLKKVSGGAVSTTASLTLDIRLPPLHAVAVAPTAPTLPFTVRLGQVTTLDISVP
jgi:hypothetical protein